MDTIYKEYASKEGFDLCKELKFQEIMDEYLSSAKVIPEMLNASTVLRKHGKINLDNINSYCCLGEWGGGGGGRVGTSKKKVRNWEARRNQGKKGICTTSNSVESWKT